MKSLKKTMFLFFIHATMLANPIKKISLFHDITTKTEIRACRLNAQPLNLDEKNTPWTTLKEKVSLWKFFLFHKIKN